MRFSRMYSFVLVVALLLLTATPAHAKKACVVVSKRIFPYLMAYEGIASVLGAEAVRVDLGRKPQRDDGIVKKIQESGCNIVVPVGSLALGIVRLQIKDKPIVYTMVTPRPPDLASSPAVAGVNIETPPSKFLKTIKEMLPSVTRVGIVYNPTHAADYVAAAKKEAARYNLQIIARSIESIKKLPDAVDELVPRVDALLMIPDPTSSNRKAFEYMLLKSARRDIPLIGLSKKHARDGALFSFAIDFRDAGRKTAEMVRRAYSDMKEAKSFNPSIDAVLVINEKTAKRLGLRIDPAIKGRAVEVYK